MDGPRLDMGPEEPAGGRGAGGAYPGGRGTPTEL